NTDQELLFYLFDEFAKLEEIPYSVSAIEYAFNQCIDNVLSQPRPKDGRKYCLRTFDGWGCWNDTPAGETAYITCPTFITGFLPERFAHKICNEDGTWYRHPHTNRTWSNYTTCIDQDDLSTIDLLCSDPEGPAGPHLWGLQYLCIDNKTTEAFKTIDLLCSDPEGPAGPHLWGLQYLCIDNKTTEAFKVVSLCI
ncbi:calcitonin receptor-like, partial [Centruroides sculpturatus]|uniref:calcitonin receptor-like n=1 Tax=Centruroides sculpturatus TaxID=218467 RepID=UPI000C6DE906